jgi:hypothetical protein
MRIKLFLSMLLMFAAALVAPAQEPQSPPRDFSPDKWDEYTSEQGRFKIRFPGTPKEEPGKLGAHFVSYSGFLDYRVSYVDEPELSDNLESAKRYLREMKAVTNAIATLGNERIVKEEEVTIDGYPGNFTYVQSTKGWIRDLQIVVGKRVYTIIVEGRLAQANELEGKDNFEKPAMAFINSFKLVLNRRNLA